jgi:hypothetical protein
MTREEATCVIDLSCEILEFLRDRGPDGEGLMDVPVNATIRRKPAPDACCACQPVAEWDMVPRCAPLPPSLPLTASTRHLARSAT